MKQCLFLQMDQRKEHSEGGYIEVIIVTAQLTFWGNKLTNWESRKGDTRTAIVKRGTVRWEKAERSMGASPVSPGLLQS